MRNPTALEDLSAKISLLVEKYNRVKDENIMLSEELAELRKTVEEQNQEILKLQEDEELRMMEIEDITQKIMKLLN
jgi:chromosome segregation ATPase